MLRVHSAVPFQVILLFLPVFLFISSSTQYEVTGVLVDQGQTPVSGLTVLLFNEKDEHISTDQSDSQGLFTLAYQVEPTSADPFGGPESPSEFKLGASYPNPFNPHTTVPFYAPENTGAVITIYSILGQEVMRTRADLSAGSHEIAVNFGGALSQGQYLLRVVGDGYSLNRPMTFVSAGISSCAPGITVRSGGTRSSMATGSIGMGSDIRANMAKGSGTRSSIAAGSQALDTPEMYRIVVESSEAYAEKQVEVPALQDHDAGTIELTKMEYLLDITIEGEGTVEEEIVTAKQFEHGTVVRLTAVPAEDWGFVEWSGDAEGTSPTVELTIDGEKNVTASFDLDDEEVDWPRDTLTAVVNVTNPQTGRTWMDRNLGADRAATSSTDELAYGDLYQWGRPADGHQLRNSPMTSTLSSFDQPDHDSFIRVSSSPWDWRSPQNDILWQGVNEINNPCPAGYRLPTEAELNAEKNSWDSNNSAGAFASPLKLPLAGHRSSNGSISPRGNVGSLGYYWSDTVSESLARYLYFRSGSASMSVNYRACGLSVRCTTDFDPVTWSLILTVSPAEGGSVIGDGEYAESDEITITASANTGYVFTHWSGDTDHIADSNSASTTVTMPAVDITLTANFDQEEEVDWPRDTLTTVADVTNPQTGRTWMDRNLGADRAATSGTDSEAYGDLYQWGRSADGHQHRSSRTTTLLSTTDQPGHGSFILAPDSPRDWRSPQNDNLWQRVNGINNPCPAGYRLPTGAEWNAERISWSHNNAVGAFASPLKLPVAGDRSDGGGLLANVGSRGSYWSSTISGSFALFLHFHSSPAGMLGNYRAYGHSVRCLKDEND